MQTALRNFYFKIQNLIHKEDGQDLVEYALVVALIAFAATAGMSSVASAVNVAFNNIANSVTTYTG